MLLYLEKNFLKMSAIYKKKENIAAIVYLIFISIYVLYTR